MLSRASQGAHTLDAEYVFVSGALLGLTGGASFAGGEEFRQLIAAKCVTEHAKSAWGVAKALGGLSGGEPFDVEGAQGLVLALAGRGWLAEEAAAFCYVFRCIVHANRQCQMLTPASRAVYRNRVFAARNPHIVTIVCVYALAGRWQ